LKIQLFGLCPLEGVAGGGMFLHPRHGRGPVVADDDDGIALIIGQIQQGGDPRMDECGVPDHAHDLSPSLFPQGLAHPVGHPDAGPHADTGVKPFQGFHERKGVTTDISGDECRLHLPQDMEKAPMGATGAEIRRSGRNGDLRQLYRRVGFLHHCPGDDPGIKFIGIGKEFLARYFDSHSPDLFFQERIQFFDNK